MDKCLQSCLWDGLPLLLQELEQLIHVDWRRVVVSDGSPQDVPKVLNWREVW